MAPAGLYTWWRWWRGLHPSPGKRADWDARAGCLLHPPPAIQSVHPYSMSFSYFPTSPTLNMICQRVILLLSSSAIIGRAFATLDWHWLAMRGSEGRMFCCCLGLGLGCTSLEPWICPYSNGRCFSYHWTLWTHEFNFFFLFTSKQCDCFD